MEFSYAKITRNQAQAHGIVAEARARVGEVSRKDLLLTDMRPQTNRPNVRPAGSKPHGFDRIHVQAVYCQR